MMLATFNDYSYLFLNDIPLLDVRAPIEFQKGAFPHSVSLPLMNDAERHEIGLCYKNRGKDAAIELGHKRVSGTIRAERIASWKAFAQRHPDGLLYCFRGGLRSQTVQGWLNEVGVSLPRIEGGYKAMRNFLLVGLEETLAQSRLVVLGGMTGTGKTDVLQQLSHGLDLEGYANHRGSSFGQHANAQPAQIDFENQLIIQMLKKRAMGLSTLVLEDESCCIGSCHIPFELYQAMQKAPLVWLEDTLENRVQRIVRDYIINLYTEFQDLYGIESGFELFARRLERSLHNIRRRLGDEHYRHLAGLQQMALQQQKNHHGFSMHGEWIQELLLEYYDPMYDYQQQKKSHRILYSGNQHDVIHYLNSAHIA